MWLATLRVNVVIDPRAASALAGGRPLVLAFFHGTQFALLAWRRRRRTAALVSLSSDGDIQAKALAVQGLGVVRGSTSRGGVRGLAALIRRLRSKEDAAFAVDGPRGPRGAAKPGAVVAARATSALLVPMGSAMESGRRLERAWDRFELPRPFSRVVVVLGAPLEPSDEPLEKQTAALTSAVVCANDGAKAFLAEARAGMVPFRAFPE